MQFIQKSVFSNDSLSKDFLAVLGAAGSSAIRRAFNDAKNKDSLLNTFSFILRNEMVDVSHLKGYTNNNRIGFMSLEKSLALLPNFVKGSTSYGNEERQKKKFLILLESLLPLESDILLRLVSKQFDTKAVSDFIFPKPKKKETSEEIDEPAE
jgi:hypothetical protein